MTESKITPPPELVQQWIGEIWHEGAPVRVAQSDLHLAARAAQWGADMELEACCHYFARDLRESLALELRVARRPKPPSVKEQALAALGPEPLPETGPTGDTILNKGSIERHRTIRRALEQLDD